MTNAGNPFRKATKTQAKLRMALFGPSGSGKTYSALAIAGAFGTVAVIDTEHGSAKKYADLFEFDVVELTDYQPKHYIELIRSAGDYDVLVIDSLTHAWSGTGGVLDMVDKAAARAQNNKFAGWREGTPEHNRLIDAILSAAPHIIVTMRSKTEYVLEPDSRGKLAPRKVGTAPVQRDGMEYEFDIVAEMNADNELVISKTRFPRLKGEVIKEPTRALGELILHQLQEGAPVPATAPRPTPPAASQGGESKPNGASGNTDADRFARQFPAQPATAATPNALYAETKAYFNARAHFDHFISKHADALAGKTLAEAVAFVHEKHWYFNKARIQQLLNFAEEQYHTTANDVLEALANACGRELKKWRDIDNLTELEAEGALLAWAAGYDLKYLHARAAEQNDTPEVVAAAERFTHAYNARRQEPA